jgi:hypothetical protein
VAVNYLPNTQQCTLLPNPNTKPGEVFGLTFDQCLAACDATTSCVGVDYLAVTQKCKLLFSSTNPPDPESNPNELFALTYAECLTACDNAPLCIAVNYLADIQKCTLFFSAL